MKNVWIVGILLLIVLGGCKKKKVVQERMCTRIDFERIVALFPKTVSQVGELAQNSKSIMNATIDNVGQVQACMRSYQNTVLLYEQAYFQFFVQVSVLRVLMMLSSDNAMQVAAQKAVEDLQAYQVDVLLKNPILYQAFCEYLKIGSDNYKKSISVQYFLHYMIQQFESVGTQLPAKQGIELASLQKEIKDLSKQFISNVSQDDCVLVVSLCDLEGMSNAFVDQLEQNGCGQYILPINENVFASIMKNCLVESTRKKCFKLFYQRGYPENQMVLDDLLSARYDMASLLGYQNFASYQLDGLMAKTPKKAEKFLWGMIKDLQSHVDKDFKHMIQAGLPSSVELVDAQTLKPWDVALVKSYYQRHCLNIQESELSNYFPLQHVLPALLDQCNRFFHIEFEPQKVEGLWADDGLLCYRIRSLKHQSVLGYVVFDLYQRPFKKIVPFDSEIKSMQQQSYMMIVPSIRDDCSTSCVGSSVVVANFIPPTSGKPTLLSFDDVVTMFREMGHALQALFGATRFTQFSGTQVVLDFVGVPSQMLECWFDEPDLWRVIGRHYKTGDVMPDEIIKKIIELLKFDRAQKMLQQLFLGLVSLKAHGHEMSSSELHTMVERLYKKTFKHIAYEHDNYLETSFMFLASDFGAAYYKYPWSRVIAADLFHSAYQRGIFEYATGNDYVTEILSPGGLRSPYEMVGRFLGRPFNNRAFLQSL